MKEIPQSISLREQAADAIRAEIVAGTLSSGSILSATTLSHRLGVSATPVREAMLDLANAGLIEPVRNRGYRVVEMGDRDLDEIIELRTMLEPSAMAAVVANASDAELKSLFEIVDAIEDAAQGGDVTGFLLYDRSLHLKILEYARNRRLVQIVAQLRDQTRLIGLRELADEGRLMTSAREHRALVEALIERDAVRAEELMRQHLKHARGIWAGRDEDAEGGAVETVVGDGVPHPV